MTTLQKIIKYLAFAFAVFLAISIIGGILGAVGLFGSLFDGEAIAEDAKTYSLSSQIQHLDIQINAADLYIKEADAFSVESNLQHLTVEEKGGVLILRDTQKFVKSYNGAMLTIYVPTGTVFDTVDITTGAGKLTIGTLSAGNLELELGAGDVSIDSLTATKSADIEGGAGRITISGGALKDLELEMGVGQLNLTSALTGSCQLDLGVGESNLTIIGNREDYKLDLEKGIGSITVDGKNAADFGSSGNGTHKLKIHGGIGSIRVDFTDENEV